MTCDLYLDHVKFIDIPVFNSLYSLFWYSVCRVTTETYKLQSVMLNFRSDVLLIALTAGCVTGSSPSAIACLVAFPVSTQS